MLIGSNSGLTQYNLAENTFSTIGYTVLFPQGLNDGIVYSILKDREGGIWVGTNAGGINYLTPGTNWFNTFCYTPGKTSAPGKVINSFCENTDGTIWIGTDNKGLWNYNPHDQSFTPVYLDAKNPDLSVHALYCDHHELWVGTYAHGVYRLNSATGKVTNYSDKNIKGLNPGSVYTKTAQAGSGSVPKPASYITISSAIRSLLSPIWDTTATSPTSPKTPTTRSGLLRKAKD